MQNAIFNFLRKVQFWLILTDFGGFFHLRGQFLEPQLYPIVLAMKRAIVRHILRNISGSGRKILEQPGRSYRAKPQILRNLNFGIKFLPYGRVPYRSVRIMWYTHLDLCLALGIFELATRKKTIGPWGPKSVIRHILPEP